MRSFYIGDDMTVDDSGYDDLAVLVVGGEIDYDTSPELRERIAASIDAGGRRLVLDLSAVTFVDSTAIGVLAGAAATLDEVGGGSPAAICRHPNVLQILEITGIDNVISVHSSRDDALAMLAVSR
jgi:anti-sigma B factor antagonist